MVPHIDRLVIVATAIAAAGASLQLGPHVDARPRREPVVADARALELRLVDAGGVGIRPDTGIWGGSYSHGTGAFHDLITPGTADVDGAVLAAIRCDWTTHVERMAGWGANGVVVPAFLELIDFDRAGVPVYEGDDAYYRVRHDRLRAAFGRLFADAREAGLDVFLKTDMLALTPPLARALREHAGELDTADPRLWAVYAAGVDELFQRMPTVRGVVVRIGEAGALYNAEGWEYRSAMAVRTPEQVRLMLNTLLPVFERHGRLLILRSWTVGVGPLGMLHTDPAVYDAVLGDITSPALVVSTKYTQGDYFSHLPPNPTLLAGPHRRLIEFQARREFEGFGAFPNFLAGEHGRALRRAAANPNVAGISLWTQEGGPLHASPMSLYPVHGFWRWIDANVYATLRLAREPDATPEVLAADWVRETISRDPEVVEGLTDVLLRSRAAVENGLYVRPFATREIRALGVESTPMMWIMEWDVVGDWSLVSSSVYLAAREDVDDAIAEGFAAVDGVRAMRAAVDRAAARSGDPAVTRMRRSLAYQESLFEALAWWRKTLLEQYRWLDTGSSAARAAADSSALRFRAAARGHMEAWADDLDFPAYDFTPALASLRKMERGDRARSGARMALAAVGILLLLGGLPGVRWTAGLLAISLTGLAVSLGLSFEAPRVAGGSVMLVAAFVLALRTGWPGAGRTRHAVAALAPMLPFILLLLATIAVRGPGYAWFGFFGIPALRFALVALLVAGVLLTVRAAHTEGCAIDGLGARDRAGSLLLAVGVTLVTLGLLLPDLATLLGALDNPLDVAPVRMALIVAVTSYIGVPGWVVHAPTVAGAVLLAAGLWLRRGTRTDVRVPARLETVP